MKEQEFQKRITDMAESFGWRWWHVPAPMRWDSKRKSWVPAGEGAGLPDLVLIHDDPALMILAEVKREGGKLSDKQIEFLSAAKTVADTAPAVAVYAWFPVDEPIIERILRSKVLM